MIEQVLEALNPMSIACLAVAGAVLVVVVIVLVGNFFSKPPTLVEKLEDMGVLTMVDGTYKCSCTLCNNRVHKSGRLCGDCDDFGCHRTSERSAW